MGLDDELTGAVGLGLFERNNSRFSIISKDQIERYAPCFYPYFSDGKEYVISYVSAYDAIEYYNCHKINPNLYKPFATLMPNVKNSDNPIVIVARIKNTINGQR